MDVADYFKGIKFTTVGKKKGMYILEARVNSGEEMIVRVLSINKAEYIINMAWKMVWGLFLKNQYNRKIMLPLQSFTPAPIYSRKKSLTLHGRDEDMTQYIHIDQPFMVKLPHDKDILDIYQREDELTLIEAFGTPQFEIKKFS